jgi:acetylglutamate synthase
MAVTGAAPTPTYKNESAASKASKKKSPPGGSRRATVELVRLASQSPNTLREFSSSAKKAGKKGYNSVRVTSPVAQTHKTASTDFVHVVAPAEAEKVERGLP